MCILNYIKEQRRQDNKLIAIFMGFDYSDLSSIPDMWKDCQEDELQYDESWDWLMPVVIKCFEVAPILSFKLDAIKETFLEKPDKTKVFINVVEFIDWYYETQII